MLVVLHETQGKRTGAVGSDIFAHTHETVRLLVKGVLETDDKVLNATLRLFMDVIAELSNVD